MRDLKKILDDYILNDGIKVTHDLKVTDIKELAEISSTKYDIICNSFIYGYMQGEKAAFHRNSVTEARLKKGYSIEDVAEELSIGTKLYQFIEENPGEMPIDMADILCEFLNLKPSDILGIPYEVIR